MCDFPLSVSGQKRQCLHGNRGASVQDWRRTRSSQPASQPASRMVFECCRLRNAFIFPGMCEFPHVILPAFEVIIRQIVVFSGTRCLTAMERVDIERYLWRYSRDCWPCFPACERAEFWRRITYLVDKSMSGRRRPSVGCRPCFFYAGELQYPTVEQPAT